MAGSWQYSFEARDRTGERIREAERAKDESAGDRECSRGAWCAGRAVRMENGERIVTPARTYTAFCPACATLIATCLGQLPRAYVRLHLELAEKSRGGGGALRTPFGPSLPLRADADALMRAMAEVLMSWEERVREVARLSVMDTGLSRRRRSGTAITVAVRILEPRVPALLALPPAPMVRARPFRGDPGAPEAMVVEDLSGADAGNEILGLHRKARGCLGELRDHPEELEGVPCRECEAMALVRAEPPSDPAVEAMHSRCLRCRAQMTRAEYDQWARRYAKWAQSAGVACRRCQGGNHGDCRWRACACAVASHPRHALAA